MIYLIIFIMILQRNCHNNELIRILNNNEENKNYLLKFENENEIIKIDTITIFIGDEIMWKSEPSSLIKISENKILLPINLLLEKYKKIYNTNIYDNNIYDNNITNISMLIQSTQPITYNLEFQ